MDEYKMIGAFAKAAANQYAFDDLYYSYYGAEIKSFNGIPRPALWLNKNKNAKRIIEASSRYIQLLWKYIGWYFYTLIKLSRYIRFLGTMTKSDIINKSKCQVLIVTSEHAFSVILKSRTPRDHRIWLSCPEVGFSPSNYQAQEKIFNCLEFLTIKDLFAASVSALHIHKSLGKTDNHLIMQAYAAFDWVIMLTALEKIAPDSIVTSEHHDRWAVLVDTYCSEAFNTHRNVQMILVQHGKEHESTYAYFSQHGHYKSIPSKLVNVSELHLYNEEQASIFLNHILSGLNTSNRLPDIHYFKNDIKLYKTEYPGFVVLVVGHPICVDLQKMLFNAAKNIKGITFLYKGHPTAKNVSVKNPGWIEISGEHGFPNVDLVVSYPSTLCDQYAVLDTQTFVHPLIADRSQNEILCAEFITTLNSLSLRNK